MTPITNSLNDRTDTYCTNLYLPLENVSQVYTLKEERRFLKYSSASVGRIFIVRFEDGDILHEAIESLALKENITAASITLLGGAGAGSHLVVGPRDQSEKPPVPVEQQLENGYEIAGVGSLFPNERHEPKAHIHIAAGRGERTITGCVRNGVKAWLIVEAIVVEIVGATAMRKFEAATGFTLLDPGTRYNRNNDRE
jgi:predicted DNA-binding protein with PD1-like motif